MVCLVRQIMKQWLDKLFFLGAAIVQDEYFAIAAFLFKHSINYHWFLVSILYHIPHFLPALSITP